MRFEVGDRVIRKQNDAVGSVQSVRRTRVEMVEVKWEADGIKFWLPSEEFRLWDKSEAPTPPKVNWQGRTTPTYITHMRSSKQVKDQAFVRRAGWTPKDSEKMADEILRLSAKRKNRSRNKAKKLVSELRKRGFE